jgi:DNA-binding transcriptional MerR regulator
VQLIDIAEVARRSRIPASALRFYEEKGLIESAGRRGQRRLFEPAVVERLALIALARAAGFSLDEIADTFPAGRGAIDRSRLSAKADELEARVRRLAAIGEGLRHAARCPEPSHFECPSFRRLLGLAASGELPPLSPAPSARRARRIGASGAGA